MSVKTQHEDCMASDGRLDSPPLAARVSESCFFFAFELFSFALLLFEALFYFGFF